MNLFNFIFEKNEYTVFAEVIVYKSRSELFYETEFETWADWALWAISKISAISLMYPTVEGCCFHIFKNKANT